MVTNRSAPISSTTADNALNAFNDVTSIASFSTTGAPLLGIELEVDVGAAAGPTDTLILVAK